MGATFEDLRILQSAEQIADEIWQEVVEWGEFDQDTVGKQLVRAADSIGANIAESFGRFHYGEKLQFLYYARGSLFETKYWLNRTLTRGLIVNEQVQMYIKQLTGLVRQLNAFTGGLKAQRKKSSSIRESTAAYTTEGHNSTIQLNREKSLEAFINSSNLLFNEDEIVWLQSFPKTVEKP